MIAKVMDDFASNPTGEIAILMKLVGNAAADQLYKPLVSKVLSKTPDFARRQVLLEQGHFTSKDFLLLLSAEAGSGTAFNIAVLNPLLRRLIDWGLVNDYSLIGSNALFHYQWNQQRIRAFIGLRILDNVLLGPAYVAKKYRSVVPAVFAEKGGDQFTGTCFVATCRADASKYVLVTAKHNVDPDEGIRFLGLNEPEGEKYTPKQATWVLHPKLDIALMPVDCAKTPACIVPIGMPNVLTRTITMGYPRVGRTAECYVLAHGGELNAEVTTFDGEKRIIISNVVAPGNSGGPVLDEAGICLGMVVQALESHHAGGVEKANSAIPAGPILEFIQPYCT